MHDSIEHFVRGVSDSSPSEGFSGGFSYVIEMYREADSLAGTWPHHPPPAPDLTGFWYRRSPRGGAAADTTAAATAGARRAVTGVRRRHRSRVR